ncbi:hypothetical protein PFISCL1PPCAC_4635, partial [Pristionchus fissidentatus]
RAAQARGSNCRRRQPEFVRYRRNEEVGRSIARSLRRRDLALPQEGDGEGGRAQAQPAAHRALRVHAQRLHPVAVVRAARTKDARAANERAVRRLHPHSRAQAHLPHRPLLLNSAPFLTGPAPFQGQQLGTDSFTVPQSTLMLIIYECL